MISKKGLFLLIIFSISQFAYTLEKKEFIISFSPVVMKDPDAKYLHLANTLPRLLYSNLKNASIHKLSSEENILIMEGELKELKIKYLTELSLLKEKYDRYTFSENYNQADSILMEEEISNKKLQIENINDSEITRDESSLPIKFLKINDKLINGSTSNAETPDLIVKGFMEELDEWIYLEIWVENRILNSEDLVFKSVGSLEKLSDLIPEISSNLKTIILGRPWASIDIVVDPSGSNVLLKNNTGSVIVENKDFLYPGLYTIEISKQGFIKKQITVYLYDFDTFSMEYSMIKEEKGMVSVQSFPAGADLYSGATWLGKTPFVIKSPVIPSLLTFKLEGYNESKYINSVSSPENINIFMQSSIIDRNNIIIAKRDNFYNSLSYFLVSLPLSILSFGMSSDYGYAYNNEIANTPFSSESNRLMQLSTIWYNVYLGVLFINISLFINTIFDLVDYINSTNNL